jgi:arabinose-5-phosphate isomerase
VLKELLEKERSSINIFFDNIDIAASEKFFELVKDSKGLIILTGVGKSGLIAEKIAVTLTSTGSRAFFLSPSNALHGDIGIVSKDDVFIMISKSGESDELLQMIPFLRNKGVKLMAMINRPNSRLEKACDHSIVLPFEKELCPHDIVPTTSTVTQMLFGDVIAIALMTHKKFSLAEFAMNHPAGKLGRQLTLRVKDLMLTGRDIPTTTPETKLVDSLVELSNKRCGCVLVLDTENHLLGIFTDGDLRRALQKHGPKALEKTVQELMTLTPRLINETEMASNALTLMETDQKHPITTLPVVDAAQKVCGIIKMHDIVQSGL